jgi:dihydroorotase
MVCLAHVFEQENALDRLEAFASLNGPAFYRLPPNEKRITLVRHDVPVTGMPSKIRAGEDEITVFDPMFPILWSVEESN